MTSKAADSSWASSPATRRTMKGNRGRDTGPELAVRRIVHGHGFRYRVNARPVNGLRRTADLLFTRAKVAVFIDGCFWHGCPDHYIAPKANAAFWADKMIRNRMRDLETTRLSEEHGWTVLRFWEHDPPLEIAEAIMTAVSARTEVC